MEKSFVILLLVFGLLTFASAKKVCFLYEQKTVSTTTVSDKLVSVTTSEYKDSGVQEEIVITLSELSEVAEEITGITTDAILLAESTTENLVSISLAANVNESSSVCLLEAITLFDDQKEILEKLCSIKTDTSSLHVVTVQNSVVESNLSLTSLCSEGPKGLLSWISLDDFTEKVKPLLSGNSELPSLVVRNLSIGDGADSFIEVLIEMLPISYKLEDISRSAWNNNTFIRTVSLGNIDLENGNDTPQHVEGELGYSFQIETNITFLSSYPIIGLPVKVSDEFDERKSFIVGSKSSYLFNNTYSVERLVPAFNKETVSLSGTFGLHEYDIRGKIISIFGINADGSPIEESHYISARVVTSHTYDIGSIYHMKEYTTTTTTEENKSTTPEEVPIAFPRSDASPYPGFRKYFFAAVIIVGATFLIAFANILRTLRKERKAKRIDGGRTYEKVIPRI